jgi:hypothetical protein
MSGAQGLGFRSPRGFAQLTVILGSVVGSAEVCYWVGGNVPIRRGADRLFCVSYPENEVRQGPHFSAISREVHLDRCRKFRNCPKTSVCGQFKIEGPGAVNSRIYEVPDSGVSGHPQSSAF